MAKVDVVLSAQFNQTLVANTVKSDVVAVSTLSDANIFQVFEIQAVEVRRIGNVILNGSNPVYANVQLMDTLDNVELIPGPVSESFIYQLGSLYGQGGQYLQIREVLPVPVMVAGETFNVGSFVRSVAAGLMNTSVSIFGNYKRLSEVDYLRLTCGA